MSASTTTGPMRRGDTGREGGNIRGQVFLKKTKNRRKKTMIDVLAKEGYTQQQRAAHLNVHDSTISNPGKGYGILPKQKT